MDRPLAGASHRPPRTPSGSWRPIAIAALALVLAACGSSTPGATPAPSLPPASEAAPSPQPSITVTASLPPSAAASAASSIGAVTIDSTLAGLLPSAIAGVEVTEAPATEDAARTSPAFAASASGFAAVQAVRTAGSDLAIASIVRLRPDADPATFYADWRPSYDEAACGPAGGVSTRETERIGGRSVDVTHCTQGVTLYHAWLGGEAVLLSVLDVGPSGLGRSLVEGATDPAP